MSKAPIATVRASSVPDFLDCPLRWAYKNIDGVRSTSGGPAQVGTALHASTAAYDQSRIDGTDMTPDDAVDVLIETLHHPEEPVAWGDRGPRKYESQAIDLHTEYCETISPARDYVAVELKCDSLDVATDYGTIRLTGTTDRVRRTPQGYGASDLKSGGSAVNGQGKVVTSGHRAQTGVYTLIAEHEIGERLLAPVEIIGLQTKGRPRVATAEIHDPADALVGNEARPGLIDTMARMMSAGLFPPNPRSMTCTKDYCPAWHLCPYHD